MNNERAMSVSKQHSRFNTLRFRISEEEEVNVRVVVPPHVQRNVDPDFESIPYAEVTMQVRARSSSTSAALARIDCCSTSFKCAERRSDSMLARGLQDPTWW